MLNLQCYRINRVLEIKTKATLKVVTGKLFLLALCESMQFTSLATFPAKERKTIQLVKI